MASETERKFLLANENWRKEVKSSLRITQGYLNSDKEKTVRVRIMGEKGFLTIKGKSEGLTRPEFEYEIPHSDAIELIKLCEKPIIDKTRHLVAIDEFTWEIDEFYAENNGLIVAEIELNDALASFPKPEWIGEEVSEDPRYFNSALIRHPYSQW